MVRVVNVSCERESRAKEVLATLLREQRVESFEREKNPAEREAIAAIIRSMPEFVRAYGGHPVDGLSEDNFHIVNENLLSENQQNAVLGTDVAGLYDFENQRILVLPEEHSLLTSIQRMVHETLHLESFLSFTAEEEPPTGKTLLHVRRIGLGVFNDEHTKRFFRDLDEAVIEELVARFDTRYFSQITALTPELERRAEMTSQLGLQHGAIASVVDTERPNGRWETTVHEWRYKRERRILNDLASRLHNANRDRFASEEEVIGLFARAALTGKLSDLARLIENTLGKGAFRALGEQTALRADQEPDTSKAPS